MKTSVANASYLTPQTTTARLAAAMTVRKSMSTREKYLILILKPSRGMPGTGHEHNIKIVKVNMTAKGDLMILSEEMRNRLRADFPDEAISQHPTKTYLSTIKAIYIVERLNDVFSIGGWTIEHEIIEDTPEYVSMKGRIIIGTKGDSNYLESPYQYGGHTKTGKNTEPADGYKSAVTDLMSKCASYLEIGIDVFKGKVKTPQKGVQQKGFQEPESRPNPKQPTIAALKKQINGEMTAKGLTDLEKKAFYEFVLSNSDSGESVPWAADFKLHFHDYLDSFISSGVYSRDEN